MARTNPKMEVDKRETQAVTSYDEFLVSQAGTPSDFDQRDMSIPFLRIIQALSEEVTKGKPSYNKDRRPGELALPDGSFVDGDDGIEFVPCFYRREGLVYTKQGSDWKFAGNLGSDYDNLIANAEANEKGELMLPDGRKFVESAVYYGFVLNGNEPLLAVICMKKSQWKAAKKWNTLINQYREKLSDGRLVSTPIFWRTFKLTTDTQSNDSGTWFVWVPTPERKLVEVDPKLLVFAKKLREDVLSGLRVARHDEESE